MKKIQILMMLITIGMMSGTILEAQQTSDLEKNKGTYAKSNAKWKAQDAAKDRAAQLAMEAWTKAQAAKSGAQNRAEAAQAKAQQQ